MDDLQRLIRWILAVDLLLLALGVLLLEITGYSHWSVSYAVGVIVGMMNFSLHAMSVRQFVRRAAGGEDASKVSVRATLGYLGRYGILVSVFAYMYWVRNINLVPALIGLMATYAGLIGMGIMNSRVNSIGHRPSGENEKNSPL